MRRNHPIPFFAKAFALSLFVTRLWACAENAPDWVPETDTEDTESDTGTVDTDTGTGTGDTDSGTGTEPPITEAGEPCWNDYFDPWHPNAGLPDCGDGLDCIGNVGEAWCTRKCGVAHPTGEINETDDGLIGWCCGELIDPCDPHRYWLPESMNFHCIPRTAPLAGECDLDAKWTGENARCEPVCDGTVLVENTVCVQNTKGKGPATFCTFPCSRANGDGDCQKYAEFSDGCCGEILSRTFCLVAELCP